jgi:UDP-N-acetylmuramoylalanine--D-glutamate ligase
MENNKRIVILGAGESGTGSAILACKQEYDVFVTDSGKIKPRYKDLLETYGISYEENRHTEKTYTECR